ncbi:unnamed protein product [Protopolystoma xenopodis]|uniref:Uncharacterized protein n=1 Tax=Protopolystoma xenopodis TaxID=117903 RepID=A0A3S5FCB4_9PLAT|nr:unnamed protein product [Protopolystoma xenopodis]
MISVDTALSFAFIPQRNGSLQAQRSSPHLSPSSLSLLARSCSFQCQPNGKEPRGRFTRSSFRPETAVSFLLLYHCLLLLLLLLCPHETPGMKWPASASQAVGAQAPVQGVVWAGGVSMGGSVKGAVCLSVPVFLSVCETGPANGAPMGETRRTDAGICGVG